VLPVHTRTDVFVVPSHVLLQELPNQGLIFLDLRTEEYFGLDAVGTRMYEAIVASGSVQAAQVQLLGEYDVDAQTLEYDMISFVDALVERGLLAHQPG
jgi:hypothetical protein